MDDFGVKYVGKEHAEHLIKAFGDYEIEIDWEGKKYGGIDLDFDYEKRQVHLSMLGYVPSLHMFPTHDSQNQTGLAISQRKTKLWSKSAIC